MSEIDVNINNQLISRTAKVIMFIKDNPKTNLRNINRELDIDYNFISKIIKRCEEKKIVKCEMKAREKIVTITKLGDEISDSLEKIEKVLK